jgi:hypothetical protein
VDDAPDRDLRGEARPGRADDIPEGSTVIGVIHEPRGEDVAGLIYYLYGPGRHEEHTDPHIVTGWRHPAELEPPLRPDGTRDFRKLTGLLKQPHAAMGMYGFRRPVLDGAQDSDDPGVVAALGMPMGGWWLIRLGCLRGRRHLADDDAVADPRHWCCGYGSGGCVPAR